MKPAVAMPAAVAIIPARYASTRLPGKMLLSETGKPLVVHAADRARGAKLIREVIIATDDPRIAAAAKAHGHRAVMTRPDHPNGTSRIAEAAEGLPPEVQIIVNVQGDEPLVPPELLDKLVERLGSGDEPMATACSLFSKDEEPADPNIVKVVVDQRGRAIYFSRALIPFNRDGLAPAAPPLKHLGLYAYRRSFLPRYAALPPTPAEQTEKLEQLRALEHGYPIAVVQTLVHHHGIDTPQQYRRFVQWWRSQEQGILPP